MDTLAICMADGCEEIEGLTAVDLLRRAGIPVEMVSIGTDRRVTGSHGITFEADTTAQDADWNAYAGIILPGGMPGTLNLKKNAYVRKAVEAYDREKKLVAAICAAPTVLADCGALNGRAATCYPGMEDQLTGADFRTDPVVLDGHILTSRGLGTAISFALAIVAYCKDRTAADQLSEKIVYLSR
ncbi:MAG: DJ-1/PfpI family protein [Oscillibacter sp.]|nr:DJ-1/PfpI family protein [Oscillibacter sp.]